MKAGKKFEDVELFLDSGKRIQLNNISEQKTIIYFYPKDDTPGCTTEAIEFSKFNSQFKKMGVNVIGISKDSLEKHAKFKTKHNLSIDLASDESGEVCLKFGVWVEKSMYGKKYMGIERSTFLLDKDLKLIKEWRKVKVKGHVEEVFSFVSNLT